MFFQIIKKNSYKIIKMESNVKQLKHITCIIKVLVANEKDNKIKQTIQIQSLSSSDMESFLKSLENPEHPLLGPTLWGLKKWRVWQPQKSNFTINTIHFLGTMFVISQYIELWFIRSDLELAMRNLSVTMLSSICVIKAMSFIRWKKEWNKVINYVSGLEKRQRDLNDEVSNVIIKEYTRYSRKVTYLYWCLVTATVITVVLAPLFAYLSSNDYRDLIRNGSVPYPEIFSSWLPFDRTRGYGYWLSVVEHCGICVYGGGVVANYDSNAVVIMAFFAGQLKLLSVNCARLFDEDEVMSYEEAVKKIKECHFHHFYLVKFSSILNSLLSPVMFLYIIICSLMICASAVQLTTEGTGNMQRIWIAEYLLALIAQLFLYCWHSNEVLFMSNMVEDGVYKSAWWSQNVRIRRSVLLLAGQLRRPILFNAGPFTALNVATFVAILKGSYSYYTLLSKKED